MVYMHLVVILGLNNAQIKARLVPTSPDQAMRDKLATYGLSQYYSDKLVKDIFDKYIKTEARYMKNQFHEKVCLVSCVK